MNYQLSSNQLYKVPIETIFTTKLNLIEITANACTLLITIGVISQFFDSFRSTFCMILTYDLVNFSRYVKTETDLTMICLLTQIHKNSYIIFCNIMWSRNKNKYSAQNEPTKIKHY